MPLQKTSFGHTAQIPNLIITIVPAAFQEHPEIGSRQLKGYHNIICEHNRRYTPTAKSNDISDTIQIAAGLEE